MYCRWKPRFYLKEGRSSLLDEDVTRKRILLCAVIAITTCLVLACCGAKDAKSGATLSSRLVLDHTSVTSGSSISGAIIVQNDSGRDVAVYACGPVFQVLLTSPSYHPTPPWPMCREKTVIRRGRSSYPVVVKATYNRCVPLRKADAVPQCTSSDTPPSLPAGIYAARVFERRSVIPLPAPVSVRITSR
jgi:hypothetical protein